MLSFIRPLLNEEVEHWHSPKRDVFGQLYDAHTSSRHAARVVHGDGRIFAAASHENMADAKATVWLLNHPHPINVGDTFQLPDGSRLAVVRAERRKAGRDSLSKVYLS